MKDFCNGEFGKIEYINSNNSLYITFPGEKKIEIPKDINLAETRIMLDALIKKQIEKRLKSHSPDMINNEYSDYSKLFESIMDDSNKEDSSLANIFKISEENQREITQIDIEILKYSLPRKVREEFMGDMYELIAQMEDEGREKSFIWGVIIYQYVLVILGQLKSFIPFTSSNKEIADK